MRSEKRTQSVTAAKVHAPAVTAHTAAGMLTSGYRGSCTASNAMNRAQAITTGDRTRARHVRVRCGGTISVSADDISGCGPALDHGCLRNTMITNWPHHPAWNCEIDQVDGSLHLLSVCGGAVTTGGQRGISCDAATTRPLLPT